MLLCEVALRYEARVGIFLACLLLLCVLTVPARAWHAECGPHYEYINGHCVCAEECCDDSDCYDPDYCQACVDYHCVSIGIESVNTEYNIDCGCVDCCFEFIAETDPPGYESRVHWSAPGGNPSTFFGYLSFLTCWDTPGIKTVTASICNSSNQKQVKSVEVASLLPDEGVEIDDGDGDPNTKSFVVGIVTLNTEPNFLMVIATPNPYVSEEDLLLSDDWTLSGGIGEEKLTRKVYKTMRGTTTISCYCAYSSWWNCSKETNIHIVKVDLDIRGVKGGDELRGPDFAEDPALSKEINPGGFIALNDDDDNNNGIPDKDESGPITGENDLVKITLNRVVPTELTGDVTLKATAGGSKIKLWQSSVKSGSPITLPKIYATPADLSKYLYVEGVETSSSARDITLVLEYTIPGTSTTFDDTINATVYKAELKSIKFTSDHGLLKDNDANWTDSGTTYIEPEWIPDGPDPDTDPEQNNPISHTKNAKLTVNVTVKVNPSGLTFDLKGDGPDSYVDFTKMGATSTGSDQVVTITADANLPNQVNTLTKSINWTIKLLDPDPDIEKNVGTSGPHKIYVTYGTPAGSVVTERRVREVCTSANGKSGLGDCADEVFSNLSGSFDLSGPMWGPSPIWLLHDPNKSSQCPGLARYINRHFQMLGLTDTEVIRYCHAKPDGTYAASTSPISQSRTLPFAGHPDPTTHDDYSTDESLVHWDGSTPPGANNYEATCLFNGYHYALGVGKFTTAKDVVKAAFTSISWEYVALDSPGPPPTYKWSTCTDVPWVEAP